MAFPLAQPLPEDEGSARRWRGRDRSQLPDCGAVQLRVSSATALRSKLRRLIEASNLPRVEFAELVFGCNDTTVWSYLQGAKIPHTRQTQIRRMESVTRQGGTLCIVTTCPANPRWEARLQSRKRRAQGEVVSTTDLLTQMLAEEGARTLEPADEPRFVPAVIAPPIPLVGAPPAADDPIAQLNQEYSSWMRSQRIREYATALRETTPGGLAPSSELGRWVLWMERHADAIDPLHFANRRSAIRAPEASPECVTTALAASAPTVALPTLPPAQLAVTHVVPRGRGRPRKHPMEDSPIP